MITMFYPDIGLKNNFMLWGEHNNHMDHKNSTVEK